MIGDSQRGEQKGGGGGGGGGARPRLTLQRTEK